ncbi:MAG: hypothetical protein M3151_13445 [Actinomycetota bacterium]|nr:hypothetical protein [Actinomycetota bacterium]
MIGAKVRRLSQRQRRMLVLAEYAGISCFPVVSIFTESAWWMLLGLLGVIATVLIHGRLLFPFTQKIANKTDADLDERQTAVRDSAHRTSYEILGTVIIVGLALLHMLTTGPLGERPWTSQTSIHGIVWPTFTTILLMFSTLPTAVIAWAEPDPEPDE